MSMLDLHSTRAQRARLGKKIGKTGYGLLLTLFWVFLVAGTGLLVVHTHYGLSALGLALLFLLPALWWKHGLASVPLESTSFTGRLAPDFLVLLDPAETYTPHNFWEVLQKHWHTVFLSNHLLLPLEQVQSCLSNEPADLETAFLNAISLADASGLQQIEVGHVAAVLLVSTPAMQQLLNQLKLTPLDVQAVLRWLERDLAAMHPPLQSFGGIGRDWANGFTPRLNQFGHNLSLAVEHNGAHFGALVDSPGVLAMKSAFSQGASSIALVGPDGIGKTSHAYALAQNLLAETHDRNLEHRQIIALEATAIISAARQPGDLEHILVILLNEASHAGNIILFLDDAQLFFQSGPGSINATQILLPAMQSRGVQLVFAMSSHDFQQLKATNTAFAGLLSPVVLQEPPEAETLEIIADSATRFEIKQKLIVTYEAVKEAYRLSGRYEVDMAYPGKAIHLLEQALTHADGNVITAGSVQAAIEQSTGVRAGSAAPAEAAQLLNLEDEIHKRMINQSRAVTVVASALRRARAGVANPNRPIGSFLFLGPTGVGKTELAKAIAATYFGSEESMIRLDMSEYQQESDVARLLSSGQTETSSLILKVRQQPFSVVLLDEIEKAHPNILNLLLQLLDEGQLTDAGGRRVSFKDAVVIATSNAGADIIREHIEHGEELETFEKEFTDQLINSGQFKPELLNRFDEIVLFRPLKPDELGQVVRLMLGGINQTLATQNITVQLTDAAVAKIVEVGNDPRLGARPMRRALQRAVENTVAGKILRQEIHAGDSVTLDAPELTL